MNENIPNVPTRKFKKNGIRFLRGLTIEGK
jgi:hypothetical protein